MKRIGKEIIASILLSFPIQILYWIFTIILYEKILDDPNKIISFNLIFLPEIILFYYKIINPFIKKHAFNKIRFDIFLFISWIILSFIFASICISLFSSSGGPFSGLEYACQFLIFCGYIIILILINIIIFVIKFIKKKK